MDVFPILSMADLEAHDPEAPNRGRERRFCCPLPACAGKTIDTEHRSLSVNTKTGAWHCHRCGASGKLKDHWLENTALPTKTRRRSAARRAILTPPQTAPELTENDHPPAPEIQARYAAAFPDSPAAAYLEGRRIPPDVAQAHGCGYAPNMGYQPRATFPILDRAGALVAINGRAIREEVKPRQYTDGPKRFGVFNPAALDAPTPVIVEAPIDALSLAVCGVPAAALIGTTAPAWLSAALIAKTVYLATDADPPEPDGTPGAGDRAARELDAALRLSRCVRLRPPDPWKDWNAALMGMGRNALSAWLSEYLAPPVAIPSDRPDQDAPEPVHTPGARVQIVSTGEQGRVVEVWGADDPGTVTDPEYVGRVLVRLDGREHDTIFHRDQVEDACGGEPGTVLNSE